MESLEKYWEVITWIAGGFGVIISALLSAIAYLIYSDKQQSTQRFDKHEEWIMNAHDQIKELSRTTGIALEHNATAIEFIKEWIQNKKKR